MLEHQAAMLGLQMMLRLHARASDCYAGAENDAAAACSSDVVAHQTAILQDEVDVGLAAQASDCHAGAKNDVAAA